jgi:hypothetical protein
MLLLCVLNSSINAPTHFWISSSVTSNRAAVLSAALRRPMICLETSWPSGLSSVSFGRLKENRSSDSFGRDSAGTEVDAVVVKPWVLSRANSGGGRPVLVRRAVMFEDSCH